jgi:DNA-binding PadR family transcriptional regulator
VSYQLTPLGISVLAFLRERPMRGYEMFQTLVARREDRIVKVRSGSLYHVVYRLAQEKPIRQTSAGRAGNRPERTIFEITDLGIEGRTDRLRELEATPTNEFPRFVVVLAEIHNLARDTAVAAVRVRIAALEADLAGMAADRGSSGAAVIHLTALDYPVATTRAKIDWLREFAESMGSGTYGVAI